MASRDQVPAKIEQIIHSGMNTQESLRLPRRLEAEHTPFSHTSRLVKKLCPVICILGCIVKDFRDEVSMRNAIAPQLVRYNPSRLSLMFFQQPLEETLCSCTVTTGLEKHINYLAILVNSPPQVLLLTTNLHKYFVDVECIAKPLMSFFNLPAYFGPNFLHHR
jgi:hypothetical protein